MERQKSSELTGKLSSAIYQHPEMLSLIVTSRVITNGKIGVFSFM
jgi:hypothetical protein